MKCTVKTGVEGIPAGTTVMIVTMPKDEKLNIVHKGIVREVPLDKVELIEKEIIEVQVQEKAGRMTREFVINDIIGDTPEVDFKMFIQAAQGYLNLRRGEKGWKRKLRKMGYQVIDGKISKKQTQTSG